MFSCMLKQISIHFCIEPTIHLEKNHSLLEMVSKQNKYRHRQFFAHTVFKFIFTTVIFYIFYDQSQARTILFCWIVLIFLVPGSLRAFPRISDFFDLHYLDFWKLIPRVWYIFCKERNSECIYVPVNMLGRP